MEGVKIASAVVRRFFQDNLNRFRESGEVSAFDPISRKEDCGDWVITSESDFSNSTDDGVLSVITYNTWGVPIAPLLETRFHDLCRHIAGLSEPGFGDVLCLQEVSTQWQKRSLRKAGQQAGLVHVHTFNHGVGFPGWHQVEGTGLMILSRYPILDCRFHRFSVNGRPHRIHHSDYLGHKGVALVRIILPCGETVDVYTTHFHASYVDTKEHQARGTRDVYTATRIAQAWELSRFVEDTRRSPLVVVAGDFNCSPEDLEWKLVLGKTSLKPAIEQHKPTYGAQANSHTKPHWLPQCLDHVMYDTSESKELLVARAGYLDWVGEDGKSVSDHLGVCASFELRDSMVSTPKREAHEMNVELLKSCEEQLVRFGVEEAKRDHDSHLKRSLFLFGVVSAAVMGMVWSPVNSTTSQMALLGVISGSSIWMGLDWAIGHFIVKADVRNFEHIVHEVKLFAQVANAVQLANKLDADHEDTSL